MYHRVEPHQTNRNKYGEVYKDLSHLMNRVEMEDVNDEH